MNTPLHELYDPLFEKKHVRVFMKRDDLIHPYISGNKWRKLKYNLQEAKSNGEQTLLTFGGAYSNHIYAVAAAGKEYGFNTIGIIRGEKALPLNPVLTFAEEQGMELHFISREDYRKKNELELVDQILQRYGNFFLLPEGGSNVLAVKGCAEIISEIEIPYDYICCPVGTGGTMAGLIAGCNNQHHVVGFSVLKGYTDAAKTVEQLVQDFTGKEFSNWTINHDYHFGGYAKKNIELTAFIQQFSMQHQLILNWIYSAKMMFGLYDLIGKGFFPKDSVIIVLHTGG